MVQQMMADARERFAGKFRSTSSSTDVEVDDEGLVYDTVEPVAEKDEVISQRPTLSAPAPSTAVRAVNELYTLDQLDAQPARAKRLSKPVQRMGISLVRAGMLPSVAARSTIQAMRTWLRYDSYFLLEAKGVVL